MRDTRKSYAAIPWEEGRHATKIRRAVSMKLTVQDSKRLAQNQEPKKHMLTVRKKIKREELKGKF